MHTRHTTEQLWNAFHAHGAAIVEGATGHALKRHVQAREACLNLLGIE